MRRRLALLAAVAVPVPLAAQPTDLPIPAATTDQYPAGVRVARTPAGTVYTDRRGHTLYGMDMRTLVRWSPDASQFCQAACLRNWTPLLAPRGTAPNIRFPRNNNDERAPAAKVADELVMASGKPPRPGEVATFTKEVTAGGQIILHPIATTAGKAGTVAAAQNAAFVQPQSAPDWTVIAGPQGPQWVYKGWHMVFVREGERPGATGFDGADGRTWNALRFVPPAPRVEAPGGVAARFVDGAYALTDAAGSLLYTGSCGTECAGWRPLPAPLASRGVGAWLVDRSGPVPQWRYHGRPVFVSAGDDASLVPAGGTILQP